MADHRRTPWALTDLPGELGSHDRDIRFFRHVQILSDPLRTVWKDDACAVPLGSDCHGSAVVLALTRGHRSALLRKRNLIRGRRIQCDLHVPLLRLRHPLTIRLALHVVLTHDFATTAIEVHEDRALATRVVQIDEVASELRLVLFLGLIPVHRHRAGLATSGGQRNSLRSGEESQGAQGTPPIHAAGHEAAGSASQGGEEREEHCSDTCLAQRPPGSALHSPVWRHGATKRSAGTVVKA
mmetsp:Transcript_48520/g.123073  ORF Transcript_48520/g.123073 Transcript_48520/m.123073 type:complete len:240 (+) Transcript_48520:160-879(+)